MLNYFIASRIKDQRVSSCQKVAHSLVSYALFNLFSKVFQRNSDALLFRMPLGQTQLLQLHLSSCKFILSENYGKGNSVGFGGLKLSW